MLFCCLSGARGSRASALQDPVSLLRPGAEGLRRHMDGMSTHQPSLRGRGWPGRGAVGAWGPPAQMPCRASAQARVRGASSPLVAAGGQVWGLDGASELCSENGPAPRGVLTGSSWGLGMGSQEGVSGLLPHTSKWLSQQPPPLHWGACSPALGRLAGPLWWLLSGQCLSRWLVRHQGTCYTPVPAPGRAR